MFYLTYEQFKECLIQNFDCECDLQESGTDVIGTYWGFTRTVDGELLYSGTAGKPNEQIRRPQIRAVLRALQIDRNEFYGHI